MKSATNNAVAKYDFSQAVKELEEWWESPQELANALKDATLQAIFPSQDTAPQALNRLCEMVRYATKFLENIKTY